MRGSSSTTTTCMASEEAASGSLARSSGATAPAQAAAALANRDPFRGGLTGSGGVVVGDCPEHEPPVGHVAEQRPESEADHVRGDVVGQSAGEAQEVVRDGQRQDRE